MTAVYLNRIEVAVPANDVHAKFVDFAPRLVADERMKKLFGRLASKCQIEHRYSVLSPSSEGEKLDSENFFRRGEVTSTATRMQRFRAEALRLVQDPVATILKEVSRDEITHLIVTSCTGFSAPGLDLELQKKFELRRDLQRTIIGFMGCYAAFNAMKAAWHIVRSEPTAKVLLVNVELCTLHLQESPKLEQLLAFLQFADGAAVSLVSAEPKGLRLDSFRADVLSEGEELIQWNIGDSGFEMVLSPDVPQALGRGLPRVLPALLSDEQRSNTNLWAIHPGGRSVLDAVQDKLALTAEQMTTSRAVLRDFGNMSSATILFVLKAMLDDDRCSGAGAAFAFGPGLTVESMRFHKHPGEARTERVG